MHHYVEEAPGFDYTKVITQNANTAAFSYSPKSLSFTYNGGTQSIAITSNIEWTATVTNSAFTLSQTSGTGDATLDVTVPAWGDNINTLWREGEIIFESTEGTSLGTVSLTQIPHQTSYHTQDMSFGRAGGTQSITFSTLGGFTASADVDWLSVTPASSETAGEETVSISAVENTNTSSRSGYVYIRCDENIALRINVTQDGNNLAVSKSQTDAVSNDGGTFSVDITSNGAWKASSSVAWCTLSKTTGTGDATITATVQKNETASTRQGTITVERTDGVTLVKSVNFSQQAGTISSATSEMQFSPIGSTQALTFTSSSAWTATASESWITLSAASGGSGSNSINVSVSDNVEQSDRLGQITLSMQGKEVVVAVKQQSAYLTTNDKPLTFTSRGGTCQLTSSGQGRWTAESDAAWLTLSAASGTDNVDMVLTATDNASATSREATVTLTMMNGVAYKFVVQQAARYLNLSQTILSFFTAGGQSNVITIDTDGETQISCTGGDWLSVSQPTASSLIVSVAKNETGEPREGSVVVRLVNIEGEVSKTITVKQVLDNTIIREGFGEDKDLDAQ